MIDADIARRDALAERLFEATLGALELFSIHLGYRLGLYAELAAGGPASAGELAARAGIDRRYAREWLEQQAVAGFLEVAEEGDAEERRFALPAAHVEVLADPDSPAFVAPFGPMLAGIGGVLGEVVEAYRSGAGVPYSHYGHDFRAGQGAINRPVFMHDLPGWIGELPGVGGRLSAGEPLRIADVGCGQGFSTVSIARAFPDADVEGFDLDAASVADARRGAADAGVAVRFTEVDAGGIAGRGPFDLICILEALHDMAHPAEALAAARAALAPGGGVLVVDERVAESFEAPGDPVERIMYGWSVTHCLPASREEEDSEALGTALRIDVVRDLARRAGFADAEVLPVENDFFRLYWLAA
jgi:SAM-dependent methyltransferase